MDLNLEKLYHLTAYLEKTQSHT